MKILSKTLEELKDLAELISGHHWATGSPSLPANLLIFIRQVQLVTAFASTRLDLSVG